MEKNTLKNTLTGQQKRFLCEYAKTLDIEKSAHKAGYKSTNSRAQAEGMLSKELYRRELEKIIAQKASYLDVCKAYIIKKYLELLEYASENQEDGPKDAALALRALDGLCKHLPEGAENPADSPLGFHIEGLDINKI